MRFFSRSKVNIALSLIIVFAVCLAMLITTRSVVHAANPSIATSPGSDSPTLPVQVTGTGFGSSEQVTITFDMTRVGIAHTNSSGAFSTTITVPSNAQPGTHIISAVGQKSGLSAQVSFLVQTDWFMFGYRAKHTHYNPYENTLNTTNVSNLVLDWKYYTTGKANTSPVIGNGVVYISSTSYLYAFDAKTGKLLWKVAGFHSDAAVVSGILYTSGGGMEAFNATTGTLLWEATYNGFGAPMVYNNVVYASGFDNNLYALNAGTGALLWKAPTGNQNSNIPIADNGMVYTLSGDGNVYAFNATNGAALWSTNVGGDGLYSSPSVDNGIVYATSSGGKLYALNETTGAILWTAATGKFLLDSSPAIANGIVYIGSSKSKIYAFNATTGKFIWSYLASGTSLVDCTPSVANGVVYFGAGDNLFAVDALTGTKLWQYIASGSFTYSSPAVTNGMVFIGSGTGHHDLWVFHLPGMNA